MRVARAGISGAGFFVGLSYLSYPERSFLKSHQPVTAHASNRGAQAHESGIHKNDSVWSFYELDFDVSAFPVLEYSNKRVLRAGEALRGNLIWTPETEAEIRETFKIANSWRDSHAFPMRSIRGEVSSRLVHLGLDGITAARVKKMPSIRKKLCRLPYKLNQMQDLGGVRAILASISQVHKLSEELKKKSKNEFRSEDDYINEPKSGGYRSNHLVFHFRGKENESVFNGRRIEVQLRTRLQHSWATAVESIGTIRNEDMKAGEGNPDWLRLFELVSAELALAEDCPVPDNLPDRPRRIEEIRDLNKRLGAIEVLDNLRYAARALDQLTEKTVNYYLVEYDHENRKVEVRSKFAAKEILLEYGARELENAYATNKIRDTVLIEADKVEDLKNAYPNYFGDVQVFISNLRRITQGKDAQEYTMPPKYSVPPPPKEPADYTWLRPGRHRRWR